MATEMVWGNRKYEGSVMVSRVDYIRPATSLKQQMPYQSLQGSLGSSMYLGMHVSTWKGFSDYLLFEKLA